MAVQYKAGDTVYKIKKASYCSSGICRSEKSCSECRENAPYRKYKKKLEIDDLKEIGKSIFFTEGKADEAYSGFDVEIRAIRKGVV